MNFWEALDSQESPYSVLDEGLYHTSFKERGHRLVYEDKRWMLRTNELWCEDFNDLDLFHREGWSVWRRPKLVTTQLYRAEVLEDAEGRVYKNPLVDNGKIPKEFREYRLDKEYIENYFKEHLDIRVVKFDAVTITKTEY